MLRKRIKVFLNDLASKIDGSEAKYEKLKVVTLAKEWDGRALKRNQKHLKTITHELEFIEEWNKLSQDELPSVDFTIGQVLLVEFGTTSRGETANIHISAASQGPDYALVEVTTYETDSTGDEDGAVSSPFHLAFIESRKPILIREIYKEIIVI